MLALPIILGSTAYPQQIAGSRFSAIINAEYVCGILDECRSHMPENLILSVSSAVRYFIGDLVSLKEVRGELSVAKLAMDSRVEKKNLAWFAEKLS